MPNLLKVAIEWEQSQTSLNSAECEQVQGRNDLNVTLSQSHIVTAGCTLGINAWLGQERFQYVEHVEHSFEPAVDEK